MKIKQRMIDFKKTHKTDLISVAPKKMLKEITERKDYQSLMHKMGGGAIIDC